MSNSSFTDRHIGPSRIEMDQMLKKLEFTSLPDLMQAAVPKQIHTKKPLNPKIIGNGKTEFDALKELRNLMSKNQIFKSYIGMGYHDCIIPPVIQRGIIENPGWYTQYTPYQAEISQGRLEALLNFQTMIMDLTGMEIANASLLDEATAAAEAMAMCYSIQGRDLERSFFISENCHPQTIGVVKTRAEALGIKVIIGNHELFKFDSPLFGALLQYPTTDGNIPDYSYFIEKLHQESALSVVAADILSLALLRPPGEFGADVVVGSTQRFGVPLGYGGPHAAFLATKELYKRQIPGRIVGVSKDIDGRPAIRLALQTREQHIRRNKATSNICTAQVLLAVIASMYGVYHGPKGIRQIAECVHVLTALLAEGLKKLGHTILNSLFFDTLKVQVANGHASQILTNLKSKNINLRIFDSKTFGISLDETTSEIDLEILLESFSEKNCLPFSLKDLASEAQTKTLRPHARESLYLTHPVFNSYHSETEMLRYMNRLQSKDLSLTTSMIPLGSCTMKLNAAAEMLPLTWPEISNIHPFVPVEQVAGYRAMIQHLEKLLAEITGFDAVSLQPNAGSQGEYAGLLVIRKYHQLQGQGHRNVCLIPQSAHGTNPASAALAGMKIVVVNCDSFGNIDIEDLDKKAKEHSTNLAALMVTYPSTHGVFEEGIVKICDIIHQHKGQVYLDGANMNAQVGLCKPAELGADVCHLNLHKTFSIPHGGGGPGVGPICVRTHLSGFLPNHPVIPVGPETGIGAISAAPYGSPSILHISYLYILMLGATGMKHATEIAILNANYIANRLNPYFPVLYKGKSGLVAHECIVDLRQFKTSAGIEVEDVAKRLMDYGFHAPTISFPVPGTMMIEPTESESKKELDRFCDAMISIREEIAEIERGEVGHQNNILKNAPHTAQQICKADWDRPYSREKAAFPSPFLYQHKYWPPVSRIDAVYGERNLVCACPDVGEYS